MRTWLPGDSALKALAKCHAQGGRMWLYVGSVQTLEYTLARGLVQQAGSEGLSLPVAEALRRSRLLICALERFKPGAIYLLTRDASLMEKCPSAISPRLSQTLKENGIPSVAYYTTPLHLQGAFADLEYKPGDFPVAEQVAQCLSIPMSPYLNREDQDAVAFAIRSEN